MPDTRYKVLYRYGTRHWSYNARRKARVTYKQGVAARPPAWLERLGYGLCVFETQEQARVFIQRYTLEDLWHKYEIWECACDEPVERHPMCLPYTIADGEAFALWEGAYTSWPDGTQFYLSVTPLRCVLPWREE